MGRHYLSGGFSYQLTPLSSIGVQGLANLGDASILLTPSYEISLLQDVSLVAGLFYGVGKSVEPARIGSEIPLARSEFGLYPDIYFSSLRFYF